MKKILCIFDMPSRDGSILSGSSGVEFIKLINEIGLSPIEIETTSILPTNCYLDNLINLKVKDPNAVVINGNRVHQKLVGSVKSFLKRYPPDPNRMIITFGKAGLFALTGELSDTSYRGSMIQTQWGRLVPTFSHEMLYKVWEWRVLMKSDIEKAVRYLNDPFPNPNYKFKLNMDFAETISTLTALAVRLDNSPTPILLGCDIETFRRSQISVIGIATSKSEALVIPFIDFTKPKYSRWTVDEEYHVIRLLDRVLSHPNAAVGGQNFHYDLSYINKQWGIKPNYVYDSMHMFHCILPGELSKDLSFLASIFCDYHLYWKDQGKDIHDAIKTKEKQDDYFEYNAKDCVNTFEIIEKLIAVIPERRLQNVWAFQQEMLDPLNVTMIRGIPFLKEKQAEWRMQFSELQRHYAAAFERVIPSKEYFPNAAKNSSPWYSSPAKTKTLLYDILGCEVQLNKKTKKPSTEDAAIQKIMKKEPVLYPLLSKLLEYRSLGVFISTFLSPSVDIWDKKMHTFYNLSGTQTFRLSSRADTFDTGANLQNIPKGDK